jgi:hypothetical protein
MQEQLVFILAVLLLTGCGTRPVPQAPIYDEPKHPPIAELRIGDDPDAPRHLPFEIPSVHGHQKPWADAPYHIEGGQWTFFDCQASSDPKVAFTIGVSQNSSEGSVPVAWGKVVLIVKDRKAGARFVASFSAASSARSASNGLPRVI